jgi:hypothetical protein
MVGLLKGLGGFAQVDMLETAPRDAEAAAITGQIANVLQRSRWKTTRNIYDKYGDPLLGILVEFDPASRGSNNIAAALVSALRDQGHLVVAGPESAPLLSQDPGRITHWAVRITVGRR